MPPARLSVQTCQYLLALHGLHLGLHKEGDFLWVPLDVSDVRPTPHDLTLRVNDEGAADDLSLTLFWEKKKPKRISKMSFFHKKKR